MNRQPRSIVDLRPLPDVVFGSRDIMWWGTLGFVVIEGFTLALCATVFVYLSQNAQSWPPPHIPRPSLAIPTAQMALMLASLPFVAWLNRVTRQFDLAKVRVGFTIAALLCGIFTI